MPQAPLPAPAARVQVPSLITPIVQQIGQPFNVLPYMQYPNMIDAATKGLKLGTQIGQLPLEGREEATQMAGQAVLKTQLKYIEQQGKDILAGKLRADGTPWQLPQDQKPTQQQISQEYFQFLRTSPVGMGQGGQVTFDPVGAQMRYQSYLQQQAEMQRQQQAISEWQQAHPTTPVAPSPGAKPTPPTTPPAAAPVKPGGQGDQGKPPDILDQPVSYQQPGPYPRVAPLAGAYAAGGAYPGYPMAASFLQNPVWLNQARGGYFPPPPLDVTQQTGTTYA